MQCGSGTPLILPQDSPLPSGAGLAKGTPDRNGPTLTHPDRIVNTQSTTRIEPVIRFCPQRKDRPAWLA